MTDNDIKELWQQSACPHRQPDILRSVLNDVRHIEQAAKLRNTREIAVGLILMPLFALIAWYVPAFLSKLGALLVIPAVMLIIYKLNKMKKHYPSVHTYTVLADLQQYKQYLLREKKLLEAVWYWYLLPCAVPLILFFAGMHQYLLILLTLPLFGFIYYLNIKAVKTQIAPVLKQLEAEIEKLED